MAAALATGAVLHADKIPNLAKRQSVRLRLPDKPEAIEARVRSTAGHQA